MENNDQFRIRSISGKDCYDLYAASDGFKFDAERRRVFCWEKEYPVNQGYWKFESLGNDKFLIKNTAHNEYLYAADYPVRSSVFTWSGTHADYADNPKFHWRLTPCPADATDPKIDIIGTIDAIAANDGFGSEQVKQCISSFVNLLANSSR